MVRKAILMLLILIGAVWALCTIHPAPEAKPLSAPIPPAMLSTLPPCVTEDGAGQPLCYWDADVQGNGMGADVVTGDCAIATVGSNEASKHCLLVWAMDNRIVWECLEMKWEIDSRSIPDDSGWTLNECFKAHL